MKRIRTVLVRLDGFIVVKGSTRGCGLRYILRGKTALGEYMKIDTNPTSLSNYSCDIHKLTSSTLRVTVREKGLASCIADKWESSASSGEDLESEFAHQRANAANREQDHDE